MSTYPPEHHLLADLGATSVWETADRLVVRAAVTDGWRGPDGAGRLGIVATLVDIACAQVAITATEFDWIATADLSLALGDAVRVGTVEVHAAELRIGEKTVVVGADLHGAASGRAVVVFARIPGSATQVDAPARKRVVGEHRRVHDRDAGFSEPVFDAAGIRFDGAGARLDLRPYVANSIGTLNGGVVALLAEAAAIDAVGGSARATDVTVRYLSQARTGTYVATPTVLRRDEATAVVEVTQVATATDAVTSIALVHLALG